MHPVMHTQPGIRAPLWQHMRPRLLYGLIFMAVLCSAIAILLSAIDGGRGLGGKFLYSFSIGLSCWLLIDVTRMSLAWGIESLRRRRGLPPVPNPWAIHWSGLLPIIAIGVLVGPSLGLSLGDAIGGGRSPSLWNLDSTASRVTLLLSLMGTAISITVIWLHESLASVRTQAEAAQRAQAESQLRLLQSQLEPHMLFNTLANLRVLISLDAQRAQQMLDRLIAYLRATLQASRADWHPLSAEFDRLADYLELMQVRMGPRLRVQLDLPAELRDVPVPPLILQPLVENSIHHGLEPKLEGGVLSVRALLEGGQLRVIVEDSGVGLRSPGDAGIVPSSGTGFGLEQVRQRLHTLYGAQASLSLKPHPSAQGTQASLVLPAFTHAQAQAQART